MEKDMRGFLKQLTLDEKIKLCTGLDFWRTFGIERLGIPSIFVADGPHGLRKQVGTGDHLGIDKSVKATCFPTASALAASFDEDLIFRVGEAIAKECLNNDVSVLLGPGINMKRNPLCGRNFEYYSEDPYLSGRLGISFVNGVQSLGVGTSLKHFAVNNQEKLRMTLNACVDERTLREIYLRAFEMVVKGSQPWTVMCSYNKINGVYASDSKYLLDYILRKEWNFEGLVVSDWGATNNRVAGLKNGLDLEMPSSFNSNDEDIKEALKNGKLDINDLDARILNILKLVYKAKETLDNKVLQDISNNHQLAYEAAANSMVLLKNNGLLPLNIKQSVGVIGEYAVNPRYQGGGSSHINAIKVDNALDSLIKYNQNIKYAQGYDGITGLTNEELINEAIDLAKNNEVVIMFIGIPAVDESEGYDRTTLSLNDSMNLLVEKVLEVNKNIVICLSNGAPILMPWHQKVSAILEGYLSGEASGMAFGDILYGTVNPSGKLAETFPLNNADIELFNMNVDIAKNLDYLENIYIGYRYYDKANKEVLYPFGYGLSYTTFEYSSLKIDKKFIKDFEEITLSITVTNTGNYAGAEIVQLYVSDLQSSIYRPKKELKGFKKVFLEIGESKEVTFTLDKQAFSYFNVTLNNWIIESGEFELLIGSSSRDIRIKKSIFIESTSNFNEDLNKQLEMITPNYYTLKDSSLATFSNEFNNVYQYKKDEIKTEYTYNSTMGEISKTIFGRLFYNIILRVSLKSYVDKDKNDVHIKMVKESLDDMPIRGVVLFSGGLITKKMGFSILDIVNGKRTKGISKLLINTIYRK